MPSTNTNTNTNTIQVSVVSDNVCPFCFVGKRALEKGIEQLKKEQPNANVEVSWRPFQLNRDAPNGVNKRERYISKFGAERVRAMEPYMIGVGRQAGIEFSYGGNTGNTFQSHRLVEWAAEQGGAAAQDRLIEALFQGYFEKEQDISSEAFLLAAAREAGLDAAAAAAHLRSDKGAAHVRDEERRWRQEYGITGVPFFVVHGEDGDTTLNGAQQPEVFKDALQSALTLKQEKQGRATAGASGGVVCGPEGCVLPASA